MNKILLCLGCLVISLNIFSQSPQAFKYQAIARDNLGEVLTNQLVALRISLVEDAIGGTAVYIETHTSTTNGFGLINLEIGNGSPISGTFSTIDWGNHTYFIKIEMDKDGGSSYELMGTSQLLSVPYALYAETTGGTSLSTHSVTELNDVTGAGSGEIITAAERSNLTTAFGWGNHGVVGYLTSYTETDPVFGAHVANGILAGDITNWDNAFSWGDHSTAGYLTSMGAETDPVFGAHVANGITGTNISNWNSAYSWGDHALEGYLTSMGAETDPVFIAHVANGITGANITNWNTAYSWGDHSLAGYLTSMGSETDPIFGAHAANGITGVKISNWDNAYTWGNHASAGYLTSYSETDPQVGTITINYLPRWNGSSLVTSSLFDNGNVGIGNSSPAEKLDVTGNVKATAFIGDGSQLTGVSASTPNLDAVLSAGNHAGSNHLFMDFNNIEEVDDILTNTAGGSRIRLNNGSALQFKNSVGQSVADIYSPQGDAGRTVFYELEGSVEWWGNDLSDEAMTLHSATGDLIVYNDIISENGVKNFLVPHPENSSKDIAYACVEGGEAGTYTRGKALLVNGEANIKLPDHYKLVTSDIELTAHITPAGNCNGLYVESINTNEIVVKELMGGKSNINFYYTVSGVRKGFEDFQVIRNKRQ